MREFLLDPRLERTIEDHILWNLLIQKCRAPLILGVFGPSGEGKTFQVEEVIRRLGLRASLISPGELESGTAGHPGEVIRGEYRRAGERRTGLPPAVVVIHDVDTGIGTWGDLAQYTVNRQQVYGTLMALSDHPEDVAGHATRRVPIILTGNDSSKLYQPLLRPGRTKLVSWAPDLDQKRRIVGSLFPNLNEREIAQLLKRHPQEPVAFWSDVAHRCHEGAVVSHIRLWPRETVLDALHRGKQVSLPSSERVPTVDEVRGVADELADTAQGARANFLVQPAGVTR